MRSPGIGGVLLLLILPCFVQAEMYQWRDEQGQIHFSDRAPPRIQADEVALPEVLNGYKPAAVSPTERFSSDPDSAADKRRQRALNAEKAEQEKRNKEERCKDLRLQARLNNISRSRNSDLAILTKKQRKREKLWADIRRYCH